MLKNNKKREAIEHIMIYRFRMEIGEAVTQMYLDTHTVVTVIHEYKLYITHRIYTE